MQNPVVIDKQTKKQKSKTEKPQKIQKTQTNQQINKVTRQLQRLWGHIKECRAVGFHIQKLKI